jgi:hypothetical protein
MKAEQTKEHIMMVGSWPCKVSSEIHINGRCVSEPVCEDKGKMMAPEPEDKRDLKRAHVVLSKGHKVVRPGYSRVTGVAAKVMDKRENSGNHDRVNRVSRNSNTYRQADQVGRVGQVTPNSSTDRRIDQVSRVDNIEQKKGGFSRVANMERRITENSANTESQIMENSANTKNWVMQDSRGNRLEEGKCAAPIKRPAPRGITKMQKRRLQNMRQREFTEKKKRKSGTIVLTVYGPSPSRSKHGRESG